MGVASKKARLLPQGYEAAGTRSSSHVTQGPVLWSLWGSEGCSQASGIDVYWRPVDASKINAL